MPMEITAHEEILNMLNASELTATQKNDLLNQLRADYSQVVEESTKNIATIEELEAKKLDLLEANSLLFRQVGTNNLPPEDKAKEDEKTFSETITLETLEGGI